MKTIYYFTADWCQPCKRVRPIVEELNKEQEEVSFLITDVDDNILLVKAFEIKSVPTFILMENGFEVKRVTGAQTKEQLEELMKYVEKDSQENV